LIGHAPWAKRTKGGRQAARPAVSAAGIRVVPSTAPGLTAEAILEAAHESGLALLVKAAAGGGGKGLRPVYEEEALPDALAGARREAQAAFGDGTVYLEKMIDDARHIEIQILADTHGNVIHLGERECSLQRRHQKLIEEAPSFVVDDELRRAMGDVAIAAARAVDYVNAGTVEFLVDRNKNFYFLEMNTRVQVEHPVTELVTGVDIVQEQLRVARGRQLRYAQEQIIMKGWAIECRINAEDPYHNFIPSTGTITASHLPTGPGIRVDTGVYEGYEVTPHYDSMISKLICYGETRGEAVLRMRRALEEYRIMGVKTNIPFHQHMMESHRFLSGQFDTKFVEERFSMGDRDVQADVEAAILATLVAHRHSQQASQIVAPGARDASNWKWYTRWERLRR
jgi:acetyl/propionyl-CoA carboxylase alpha subunit